MVDDEGRPVYGDGPEAIWGSVRAGLEATGAVSNTGVSRETYLDAAERITRVAVPWQDRFGAIIDPYLHFHTATCTPRFVGALGQLIGHGRCEDLVDVCISSYEYALACMTEPRTSPEFAAKELVLAHRALRDRVSSERLARWESHWRDYSGRTCYNCVQNSMDHNFNTFALVGEFLRTREGLGGDAALIEELLEKELGHVDGKGMYHDPKCPMTYHLVVVQQLSLLLYSGYEGAHFEAVSRTVRRGGLASLFLQSSAGQAPFGGRSNQFHFMEAHSAGLFEVCARFAMDDGDPLLAGAYKRAARRGVGMTLPWIMDMEPYRHIKQGFHPELNHGTDSGGPYSIYGTLTASLLCTAATVADEKVAERVSPSEVGGYVFPTVSDCHQVTAACGGWSVQVDTRANLQKDATGLGRVAHVGLRPEMILSGSISSWPDYSFAFDLPQRNTTIGPEWTGPDGAPHRLADYAELLSDAVVQVETSSASRVCFEVIYSGDMDGVAQVLERYELSPEGLRYTAQVDPRPEMIGLIVPVIENDGDEASEVSCHEGEIEVRYRGEKFRMSVEAGVWELTEERNSNRNATYRTAIARCPTGSEMALIIS
jgi:hypothetical protein